MSFHQLRVSQKLKTRRIREKQLTIEMQNEPKVYVQRELTDTTVFPFGKHKLLGTKMADVPMAYYRWFLSQDWHQNWPTVTTYAKTKLNLN